MSYDFSHLSPQDTKTAMRLVQKIQEITTDIELCSSDTCKRLLSYHLTLHKNLLDIYTDPNQFKSYKEYLS